MWQRFGALLPCIRPGPLECASAKGDLQSRRAADDPLQHGVTITLTPVLLRTAESETAAEPAAGLCSPHGPTSPTSVTNADISLVLEDASGDRAGNCGDSTNVEHIDSLLASLLNSMAARHLTTCTSLETLMEGACLSPATAGPRVDTAALAKNSSSDAPPALAAKPQCEGSPGTAAALLRTGSSSRASSSQRAAAKAPTAAGMPPPASVPPPAPPPLCMSPFNAVSAPFLDGGAGDESGGLPLCHTRLGGSHSCTFTCREAAVPGVCIGALSGEEPLQRPQLSSRPSASNAGGGGGAKESAAAGTDTAGPAAASSASAAGAAELGVTSAAGALPTPGTPALAMPLPQGGERLEWRPQVVASLRELFADVDNLSPMASTAAALAPAAAAAAGGSAVHTCWQGTWQKQRAVVVKLVAGSGGSGWCRPDAPLLRGACRAAHLAAAHPNLAPVLAVRALVVDTAVLNQLRQLLCPPPPPSTAGLSYAAWEPAGAQREAALVLGATSMASGVFDPGSGGSGGGVGAAAGAAKAATLGALQPVGRLQRFLMHSPLWPPLQPPAGGYLHPALAGRPEDDSACLNLAQVPGALRCHAATSLASHASYAATHQIVLQQHLAQHLAQQQQQQQHLLPVLRALARLRLPPGGCVVVVITEMCDMGNLAALACTTESPFRPSCTWPLHVAHRALLRTAREIAAALAALHAAGVPHGCLTPTNVLIQSADADRRGFVARVADAGSPALSDAATNPLASVSPRMLLLPPEALMTAGGGGGSNATASTNGSSPAAAFAGAACGSCAPAQGSTATAAAVATGAAFAVDVFSFGMLLYIMAAGRLPYADEHLVPALVGIAMEGRRPEWPTSACGQPLHPHLEPLFRDCLAADPARRPSAQQVYHRICHIEAQLKAAKASKRPSGTQ